MEGRPSLEYTRQCIIYGGDIYLNWVDWPGASSRCDIGVAREGNNYEVLLKKIAAMFTFSLSALTHIGRQGGEWELLLKYDHDDVHNFKTCRAEYLHFRFKTQNTPLSTLNNLDEYGVQPLTQYSTVGASTLQGTIMIAST